MSAIADCGKQMPLWCEESRRECVSVGAHGYVSGLIIDGDGRLQKTAPDGAVDHVEPLCSHDTYSFNGHVVRRPYSSANAAERRLPGDQMP